MIRNIVTLFMLAVLLMIVFSCGGNQKKEVIEKKATPITTSKVAIQNLTIERTYTGTIEGFKQANIFASIPEAVVALPIVKGGKVESGQAVILLDKNGAASRYTQAHAHYLDSKDNFEKMGQLYDQGAISQQTYNSVKTGFEIAKADFESARQQVELTSPISGTLTDLAVNIGDYAPVGTPIATIAQIEKMRMTIFIESRGALYIKKGENATVLVDISNSAANEYHGTISDVSESADPATRMFRVEVQFSNSDGLARPGMFARAVVTIAELEKALVVPKEAVFAQEGVSKVFVLEGDRAKEKTINIGESAKDVVQILSGLSSDENVIVLGRTSVVNGSLVKVIADGEK